MDEEAAFVFRKVRISIGREAGILGRATFEEWRMKEYAGPDAFFQNADDWSFEASRFADVVRRNWHEFDFPGDYGTMVEFRHLVIDTARDSARAAAAAIEKAMEREFRHRASVVLLLAFPLEFESNLPPADAHRTALFQKRRQAMQRLYSRDLHMKNLPDQERHPGWMWRPMRRYPAPLDRAMSDADLEAGYL
jgi:hypothetical protein